jgi:hypothetical protein
MVANKLKEKKKLLVDASTQTSLKMQAKSTVKKEYAPKDKPVDWIKELRGTDTTPKRE